MKCLLNSERGALTIEMAFLVPIFFLVMWFGAEAAFHYRVENRLHRATATLAEMLANIPAEIEADVPYEIRRRVRIANDALQDMMGDKTEGSASIRVSYLNTAVTEEEAAELDLDMLLSFIVSTGRTCHNAGIARPLRKLTWDEGGKLTTELNVAQTHLVRVEGCYRLTERMNMLDLVFPRNYYSSYTTLRRE